MIFLWILLGVLVVAVIVAGVIGSRLPASHSARRAVLIPAHAGEVYGLVADFDAAALWRRDLKTVEPLPSVEGRRRFREIGKSGLVTYEVVEESPPHRIVVRIADERLPFSGAWTWEFEPEGDGVRVTVTEDARIHNAWFRFMARYIFGYTKAIDEVLSSLADHFEARRERGQGPVAD